MPAFTIEHLTPERLSEAWPIIRSSGLYPRPEWWLTDAVRLIGDGGGVLAARAADGIVHGVAIYTLGPGRHFKKVLSIWSIVTFELRRDGPARCALCEALDELSLTLECKGIEMRDHLCSGPSMAFF